MQTGFRMILVLTVLTGASGCAYKPQALPVRQISQYGNRVTHQEVALAAAPFDRTTSRSILGQPVNQKGFQPILVVLENDGDQRAIIDGSRIALEDGSGERRERISTETVLHKCRKSVPMHQFFFGALAALGAAEYNTKMTEDWTHKAFPEQAVIEPHMSLNGVVFFRIEKKANVLGGRLCVPLAANGQADYEEVSCELR